MFAIIRTGGKQYRVQEGDRVVIEALEVDEGAEVTFDDVLLVGDESDTKVGAPLVAGASVTGTVESQGQGKKVIFFDYKNKTRQKRMVGHRQHETRVVITGINAG